MWLVIWTAFCLGNALVGASGPRKVGENQPALNAFGWFTIIWAAGLLIWMLVERWF
jgi:hypothetical protein